MQQLVACLWDKRAWCERFELASYWCLGRNSTKHHWWCNWPVAQTSPCLRSGQRRTHKLVKTLFSLISFITCIKHLSIKKISVSGPLRGQGSRGKCPGTRGPKGAQRAPSKNLSWCEKRWKRAGRNAEVKKKFIRHNMPPVAQWDPRPATCCWMTQKLQTGPKSVESKETRLF